MINKNDPWTVLIAKFSEQELVFALLNIPFSCHTFLGWAYPAKTRKLPLPVVSSTCRPNYSTSTVYFGYKLGNKFVFVCVLLLLFVFICIVELDVVPTTGCHEMETILTLSTTFIFHDKLKGIIVDKSNTKTPS